MSLLNGKKKKKNLNQVLRIVLSRKAYSLIFRNCPHLRTVWVMTMGTWGYHQIVLSAQLLKETAFENHEEAVTKGVKDNYV